MTCQRWHCHVLIALVVIGVTLGCRSSPPKSHAKISIDPALPTENSDQPVRLAAITDAPANSVAVVSYSPQVDDPPEANEPPSPLPSPLPEPEVSREPLPRSDPLQLRDVIVAVQQTYPLLIGASFERRVAGGKRLSAQGKFDLHARTVSIAAPQGFYKTYRNRILLDQPLFRGGYVYGGYKIGDGNFQPWFGERETNEGGELSAGLGVPLLKNRAIDKRRAELFQANLARRAVEPAVRAQLLEFVRIASQEYWSWVAAGQALAAQQELLENAQARVSFIEARVRAGDLERIARINNDQLIAARETKVIEAERKLQQAAIKLSLFYRTSDGEPVIPDESRLLEDFPEHTPPDMEQVTADSAAAVSASPELAELNLTAQQVRVELRDAENMLLPKMDALVLASKDVGAAASSKGDKTPFELEAGLYGEVPLQRREARGKIESARGKLAQIDAKRQFLINKITAAVQDAYSALEAAAGRIDLSKTNLRLARETLRLGRIQFDANDISLIDLNIYEKAVTDAQLLLIAAEADYFSAFADYRAALSLAPIATDY